MNCVTLISGTVVLLLFTWFFSVKHKRYHGIPRFFSFESIFILTVLNTKLWFHDPFSVRQIISWILLAGSAYSGIAGFLLLAMIGKPGKDIEATTVLVRSNIYKYIRHPLYMSLILLGTGIMMKDTGLAQLILGTINILALYITARIEEKEMQGKFGQTYSDYIKETKMFLPLIF
jgi:protein-S-isoprenylcysteine O-methyltransferase Ste14